MGRNFDISKDAGACAHLKRVVLGFLVALVGAGVLVGALARAASDDDEDGPVVKVPVKARQNARAYLGSRDEQELKVQQSLPQPSRFPENASAAEKEQLGGEPAEND